MRWFAFVQRHALLISGDGVALEARLPLFLYLCGDLTSLRFSRILSDKRDEVLSIKS